MLDCFDYAIRYISRYPKTIQGIRDQLYKKGYEADVVDETIQQLVDKQYLDDTVYAELYLRSEVVRKGKPLFLIQQKLLQKGVDRSIINHLIQELEDDIQQGMYAKLRREYEKLSLRGRENQKIAEKLVRRGYGFREVQDVVEKNDA